MIRPLSAILLLFGVLAAACLDGDPSSPTQLPPTPTAVASPTPLATCPEARPHATGDFDQALTSGGIERHYLLHVPASYSGESPVPVVLSFHGYGMSAAVFGPYTGFGSVADSEGFIVVTPDAVGSPAFWNSERTPGAADDVAFVRDLLAALSTELCIDEDAVYAAGFSNGGGMALRLACDMPDRVRAVGVVAATFIDCLARVPIIAFHGTSDSLVPYEGGSVADGTITFPKVRRSMSEWARTLGCDGLALISRPVPEVELSTYPRCVSGRDDALLYTILTGGHTWPGAKPLPEYISGYTTEQIDATARIWQFFDEHAPAR